MNELENKNKNTESHLIQNNNNIPPNVVLNKNNKIFKMQRLIINKKINKKVVDKIENLSNLEKIATLNEQNHHIKEFLIEVQKNKRKSIINYKKSSSKENNQFKSTFFYINNNELRIE